MEPQPSPRIVNNDSKITLITLVILYIVSIIAVGFLTYSAGSYFATKNNQAITTKQLESQISAQLPVSTKNPFVLNVEATYLFKGKIENYNQENKTFNLKGPSPMVSFKLSNHTRVVEMSAEEASPSSSEIKQGDSVRLTAKYFIRRKVWDVLQIVILK